MKTTVEKLEGNHIALEVEVDEERVEQAIDEAFQKVVRQVKIPGFRAGKAPRRVVENRVGKDYLRYEALEELIPEVYAEAIQDNNLRPIDIPPVDILDMEEGKPLRFRAVLEVEPEVTLGEYKGLPATRQIRRVTNADVDEVLENMRERSAQLVTTERNELIAGDFAVIDFTGYVDDQPFPGGAAQGHTLEIGSGQFIPGFEDQLIGAKVGETRAIEVTFPEDYGAEHLAGKDARFDVVVHEIKEKKIPAINDDFAKDMGDFETLLELRASIRQNLEQEMERLAERALEGDLIQALVDGAEVDIPQKMVDFQIDQKIEHIKEELANQGLDEEQYLEILDMSPEELREQLQPEAEMEVRTSLVVNALIDAEDITVSDEEVDERIDTMAGEGARAEIIRNFWETQRTALQRNMVRDKAIAFLVENAQISEVEIDESQEEPSPNEEDGGLGQV